MYAYMFQMIECDKYYSPARFVFYFADVHGGGTSSCSTSGIWRGCKQLF